MDRVEHVLRLPFLWRLVDVPDEVRAGIVVDPAGPLTSGVDPDHDVPGARSGILDECPDRDRMRHGPFGGEAPPRVPAGRRRHDVHDPLHAGTPSRVRWPAPSHPLQPRVSDPPPAGMKCPSTLRPGGTTHST